MGYGMGRTKRKRLKKYKQNSMNFLCYDEHVVSLQKWMSRKGWKNHNKLSLQLFPETGRGISSKMTLGANEVLLSIPLNIMITYNTIKLNIPVKNIFTIHESLALFLVNEKEKGIDSYWREYIESLPEQLPPLTWLANEEEVEFFSSDLKSSVEHITSNFKQFLNKIKDFIPNSSVLDENLLKWAYVMVNTRAVYVDPHIVCEDSSLNLLRDEPFMALCPFLDMFNHHYLANTEVSIINKGECLFYELKTLSSCKKYDQIFISYGSHDNIKLLTEYGFFLPDNCYDNIKFTLDEVLKILKFNLDHNKYKFIKEHDFHNNLYIGYNGISYNLKAVLFVGWCGEVNRLDSIIFSTNYPRLFLEKKLPNLIKELLTIKKTEFTNDLIKIMNGRIVSESAQMVLKFVKFRFDFINEIILEYG